MTEPKREKLGLLDKRREKKRLKRERTGDTREKMGERPAGHYDPTDMAERVAKGAVFGGGSGPASGM